MIREVEADKTLLVNGPASVRLISGEVEILGASFGVDERIIIRDGKRLPFYAEKKAVFDIIHGEDSVVDETSGNTVPTSWFKLTEEVFSLKKPAVAMIMGDVDSGKTSVCTFLVNSALKARLRVAVVDADLGQSDIGPPTTIGLAYIDKPVKDLFHVEASNVCFVGFTNPSGAKNRIAQCIVGFKNQVFKGSEDLLVVNTDGWVKGEEAVQYKIMLAEKVAPNVVVMIQQKDELAPILLGLKKTKVFVVSPSTAISERDREKRQVLRELSYRKYLKNAKIEAFPLGWTKIEGMHSTPDLFLTNERLKRIEEMLGVHPVFCEETINAIWVVLRQGQMPNFERLQKAEEVFNKKVKVLQKGDEEGLIVGLHDAEDNFLGIGVICDVDYRRKVMKIHTSVTDEVATIRVGNVRLDAAYREISTVTPSRG
ncbi:MAG: Clp1/GlmU family protein [Candidatus Bathyarchaeia archaeon]